MLQEQTLHMMQILIFPDLDEMPEWKLVKESEEETYFDIEYQFLVYQK
mgnify:CR=1 FL=1